MAQFIWETTDSLVTVFAQTFHTNSYGDWVFSSVH